MRVRIHILGVQKVLELCSNVFISKCCKAFYNKTMELKRFIIGIISYVMTHLSVISPTSDVPWSDTT